MGQGLWYVLAAVDRAPPASPQTLRLMMRIAQDHRDRFPSAQFLDRIDIDPGLNEPSGKGAPKVMEAEPRDPRLAHRRIECPQQVARIPWVACPIEKDRLGAAGPSRGAGL